MTENPPSDTPRLGPQLHDLEGEGYALEERNALRRVAGIRTDLEDITEVEYRQLRLERVVLVGVWTEGSPDDAANSMQELQALAETAGCEVLDGLIQRRYRPDPKTYIGSGKAVELRDAVVATGADTVVCDGELSPSQRRNLEDVVKVKVVDRTALILDIFAQHATSREGRAQVELAQLSYLLPRLRGWGESLSRQSGGIGARRGPGETKLEIDRRRLRSRITRLKRELVGMTTTRQTKRAERRRSQVPSVAIAGYTNAGKSSLLNRLTGAGVLVENALFATLDPTVRRSTLPDGRTITLTDTVGFVRHLPHQLVEAFKSTIEEISEADLVVHVVDGSHADPESQLSAVREVLSEVGASDIRELVVVNKCDIADELVLGRLRRQERHALFVSAKTGEGLRELLDQISLDLPHGDVEVSVLLPYGRGDLVDRMHREGELLSEEHTGEGTVLKARVPKSLAGELEQYALA